MWLLVKMDNLGTDYYDVNDLPFSIILAPTSGAISEPLQVGKQGSDVEFTWGASCSDNDTNYSVYQGTLGAKAATSSTGITTDLRYLFRPTRRKGRRHRLPQTAVQFLTFWLVIGESSPQVDSIALIHRHDTSTAEAQVVL